ncbi:MAG TPA: hypothetical protein VI279_08245 [Rhodocyclaceae bacterium]
MSSWAAEPLAVRVVSGEESLFVQQTVTRIDSALRKLGPDVLLEPAPAGGRRLVLTVGARGWRTMADAPSETPLFAIAPPSAALEGGSRKGGMLILDPPFARLLNLAQLAMPKRNNLGLLSSPTLQARLGRYESLANDRGQKLIVEKVEQETEVGAAVERLLPNIGALLAMPDAVTHNATTVQPLLLLTYRAGLPVIGYSESYLRAGAALAVYSTPEQIAQQVAEIVSAYQQGRALPGLVTPKYYSVGVNQPVARSLGLNLPPGEELEVKLRQMRE